MGREALSEQPKPPLNVEWGEKEASSASLLVPAISYRFRSQLQTPSQCPCFPRDWQSSRSVLGCTGWTSQPQNF